MADVLDFGALSKTALVGKSPENIVVQLLRSKPLKNSESKRRLLLWDGTNSFDHTVLNLTVSSSECPSDWSIIRIGSRIDPSLMLNKMPSAADGVDKGWALSFTKLELVREGGQVGRKVERAAALSTPPCTPGTPSTLSTATPVKQGLQHSQANGRGQAVKRNLMSEAEFTTPAPKRPAHAPEGAIDSAATHLVDQINPYTNKFTIKVLVEQKSSPRQIHSANFQGTVIDCILTDSSGQIKMTAWNDEVPKLEGSLAQGSTYCITGAKVQAVRNQRYNSTNHNYELTWTQLTSVSAAIINAPITPNFKLTPINALLDMPTDTVVDVLGWVKETGPLDEFKSKAQKDYKKRVIILADDSDQGACVEVTLWGETAANFIDQDKVIAVKGAKVQEFQGKKGLSLSFGGTMTVEPAIPELERLKTWAAALRLTNTPALLSDGRSDRGASLADFVTIQDIKDSLAERRENKKFKIVASVIQINSDRLFYRACNRADGRACRKGVKEVEPGSGLYFCPKCNDKKIPKNETLLRYLVNMCLADSTTHEYASMFDADKLFNMTAEELEDLRNNSESQFQAVLDKVRFSQMEFLVSARVETFNDQPKLKLNVEEVTPLVYEGEGTTSGSSHVRKLWNEIRKMEQQLGLSHEEEFGVDLTEEVSCLNSTS